MGRALEDSIISFITKRLCLDNLHYIGDPFWEYYKEIDPETLICRNRIPDLDVQPRLGKNILTHRFYSIIS